MLSDLIVYMLCLYLFIILIYFFKDYRKYKNHHRNLEYLKENLDFLDDFPQDIYLEEKTYQEIIQQLHKKAFQLSKDNQQKYNEMIDYYTKGHKHTMVNDHEEDLVYFAVVPEQ